MENPTKYHLEQICRKQSLVGQEPIRPTVVRSIDDKEKKIMIDFIQVSQSSQQDESSPDSEITSEVNRYLFCMGYTLLFFSDGRSIE